MENATVEMLTEIRDHVRATNVKLEATNVKLEATNEKLEATNEKLEATNEKLEATRHELRSGFGSMNARIDRTNERIDHTNGTLERIRHLQVESEMRLSTEIVDVAGVVQDVRRFIRGRTGLHDRVERCELEIDDLKKKLSE